MGSPRPLLNVDAVSLLNLPQRRDVDAVLHFIARFSPKALSDERKGGAGILSRRGLAPFSGRTKTLQKMNFLNVDFEGLLHQLLIFFRVYSKHKGRLSTG
jgi:hypothetical protein